MKIRADEAMVKICPFRSNSYSSLCFGKQCMMWQPVTDIRDDESYGYCGLVVSPNHRTD